MATNPLIAQGVLNKARASVTVPTYPNLNVTASYLGADGISFTPTGKSVVYIPTLTGTVRSPQPYMLGEGMIHLLRTQSLAYAYKLQMEYDSAIGDITIRGDTSTMGSWQYYNCSITEVETLRFNGTDAGYVVHIEGYYLVNNSMFDMAPTA